MYENKTDFVILNNMLDKVTTPVAKTEGSLIYDALSPVANELAKHYMELDAFIKRAFVQTSHSGFLDLRGAEYGLYRKAPASAATTVIFTGTDGTTIPAGFLVQTVDGKQFKTMSDVTIADSTASVIVEAVVSDLSSNTKANTIIVLPILLAGVSSVNNPTDASGGTGTETDDDFRDRILDKVRYPGSSGNASHYAQWALEVNGTGAVKVYPLWDGPGTVKVAVLDTNREPATEAVVAEVASHIEASRPIGATVTVVSGVAFPLEIVVHVVADGTKTREEISAAMQLAIQTHLQEIAFDQDYVSYARLSSVVLGIAGVSDHTDMLVNNLPTDVDVPNSGVAVLSELIVQLI